MAKVLLLLLLPPSSIIVVVGLGLVVRRKFLLAGRLMIVTGLLVLYALSIQPVSEAVIAPLEEGYPPLERGGVEADAIVVLSGGLIDLAWLAQPVEPSDTSLRRLAYAVSLYRRLRIPLVIAGGSGDPSRPGLSEGKAMANSAVLLGVPRGDMAVEDSSRNTLENAVNIKGILGEGGRIVLVTSAYHMERAVMVFEREGFDVIPAPCDFRREKRSLSFYSFIPTIQELGDSSTAIAEYLSRIWYRLLV